ncbi:hypothetical protein Cma02nite_24590 [Cellulomonas marina]|nr:hypothetical protein Cma02nite_24590 [Cellulomonas marina]
MPDGARAPDEARAGTASASAPAPAPAPAPEEPGAITGRHAVVRGAPVPPPEPGPSGSVPAGAATAGPPTASTAPVTPLAPVTPPAPATTPAPAADRSAAERDATASTPGSRAPWAADDDATPLPVMGTPTRATEPGLFPDPDPPRSASVGRHVLGVLLGLVLAPVVAGLLVVGQGRVLAVGIGAPDVLGIACLAAGALLAAAVVGLATWSAAVPVAAGLLLAVAGGFALVAPGIARTEVLGWWSWGTWRPTVLESLVSATSGTVLVAGLLVLVGGLTAAATRRRGYRLGVFRERHHPGGPVRR